MEGTSDGISMEELALATRNHGMPLEALRYDTTPTGLHYLLIHYDIPAVDAATWSLEIDGAVARPTSVGLSRLRSYPALEMAVTMECAGNGRARLHPRPVSQPWLLEAVGNARWTGVAVRSLLQEVGPASDAVEVLFTGIDRGVEGGAAQAYQRSLPMEEVDREDVILAYAMNGDPLLPQHGAPLRLVVPGWYGMTNVKWLERITVLTEPFAGHQHEHAYRMWSDDEEDAGEPVSRMQPRSLMVPPGIPEFMSRKRIVAPGEVPLMGRAWSGFGSITGVEVSVDGGTTWEPARVEPEISPTAWQRWDYTWQARPGPALLCSRATDASGRVQPLTVEWNRGGYQVNAVQRVEVEVLDPDDV